MRIKTIVTMGIGFCIVLLNRAGWWRTMSKKYVFEWKSPFHAEKVHSARDAGNVCIVDIDKRSEISKCVVIPLFPNVYASIGVDEARLVKWQNDNGFDSNGTDRAGNLLASGYPVFSSLAWTIVKPAYLEGSTLSQFLLEINQAYSAAEDPVARANLRMLSEVAEQAKAQSKVLRIG